MVSLYVLCSFLLFLYSYTQVDLSLTLSQLSIYQTIEKSFQYIGWFNRPLSTALFVGIVIVLFVLYIWALRRRTVALWSLVIPISIILVFSYPAFSYDLFNYMFDAKTILIYHKIPYTVTPLTFQGVEPWLSFMHWTHIPSTFPPFWIVLTIPFYLVGFGYFLGIMWSFKTLAAISYLAITWFIWKTLKLLDPKEATYGALLFALNPLVIVEALVSGHNDITMMAFAVAAFYLYIKKNRTSSFLLLSLSAATKIVTASLVPLFLFGWSRKGALLLTAIGFLGFIFVTHREIQPWYFLWFIPWYALLPREKWLSILGTGVSLGFLLRYAPFLYTGGYLYPVPLLMQLFVLVPTGISVLIVFARRFKLRV